MFAQHGLPRQHRPMTYQNMKDQTWGQQQKIPSRFMGTSGSTWPMRTTNRLWSHSMCALSHSPSCQQQDWQNKASQYISANNQQSHTQTGLKQSYEQRKEHTSCLWTTQEHHQTTNSTRTRDTTRNQSNSFTQHIDTRRNTMGDTSTWHLDLQRSRIPGETPQRKAHSNIHTRSTVSSPNGQTWGLQKDNSTQTRWNNRRLCGTTSQPWSQHTKEKDRHSMGRRNMVQGQERRKTTTATNCNTRHIKQSPTSIPISNSKSSYNQRGDTLRRSQRGLRRWQQATGNSRAAHNNHTQQQAFQDRRRFQQQRMTIGHEKDISGNETT